MLLLFSFVTLFSVAQKKTVIENPYYEVRNSGIYNISRVELSDKDTRIYMHITLLHNMKIEISSSTFIQPEGSDQKIIATGVENGEFDKEIYMPESNDLTFILIFPSLDKLVEKFDYGREDKTIIYGVSLDKEKAKQSQKVKNEIPVDIQKWLDTELEKVQDKPLIDYDGDSFFGSDDARLIGYIKGYDPRLGFNTGVIYIQWGDR